MKYGFRADTSDVLSDVLNLLRLQSRIINYSEISAPWAVEFPPGDLSYFHIIEKGYCWLRLNEGTDTFPVSSGDLVIVPHGGHILGDSLETSPLPLKDFSQKNHGEMKVQGGGESETNLICGAFEFENVTRNPLLAALPGVIYIRGGRAEVSIWLEGVVRQLSFEARHSKLGSETILSRLTDVLLVQAVRVWAEEQVGNQKNWVGALRNRQIGAAIGLIHRQPKKDWSVETLAKEVGMSRSKFAEKFTALVGEPPITYLTKWRMHLAATALSGEKVSVKQIGERVGYISETTFSKVFKRFYKVSPSAFRRSQNKI